MTNFVVGKIEIQRELQPVIDFAKVLGLSARIVLPKSRRKARKRLKTKSS